MIENKPTYQPIGTRVLLHMLPAEKSTIVLPDGVRKPGASLFEVRALGPMVNDGKFELAVGDIVQIAPNPGSLIGTDGEQQLLTVDRFDINVIVK